jgi:hypothetical protein
VFTNRTAATDVWNEVLVSERLNGEIGLYKLGENAPTNVLALPLGTLGVLRSFAASPDLRWLAMSGRTRGGVWDLEKNERLLLLRGFQSAYYTSGAAFLMDLPKFEKAEREMDIFDPVRKQGAQRPVTKDNEIGFFGDVLLQVKHDHQKPSVWRNLALEVHDSITQQLLWSRAFPKVAPSLHGSPSSGQIVLLWNARADGLRDDLARDPKSLERWAKENPGESDFFLEVVNARAGTTAGGVVVRTGKYSFVPENMEAVGDWLVVTDNHHRVLLYSIATGELKARWFGYRPQLSQNGERLCLTNGRGRLTVYDLRSLKQTNELSFAARLSLYLFSHDGKQLFALTDDQTAFTLDTAVEAASEPAAKR